MIDSWIVHDSHPTNMLRESGERYSSPVVTALGDAFTVVSTPGQRDGIRSWRVAEDMLTWSSTGNADIGSAWV